ncbi:MAG: mechanosensitive ion channel domain-containing protein [Candidatus Diapherotrites archaeon]
MLEQYINNMYLRASLIFLIFFLGIRVFLFFIERVAIRLSEKTKTDIDDKLIAKSSLPLTFLAFLISLKVTISEVNFTENVLVSLNNLVFSLIIITSAWLIYVVINTLFIHALKKAASKTKTRVDDSLINLFKTVLNISLIILVFLYVLNIWGVSITPLLAGLGIAGLAVALALQPVLSNVFSGAAMILDHSVRKGDLVYLDKDTKGKIMDVGLRSTKIQTFDNELIIFPNNKLADSMIQNVALPEPKSRTVIPFSVAYGSDIEKVKRVILKEIKKIKYFEENPEPLVRFIEMANSSLDFKAYFYVDSFEHRFEAIDEANTRIYKALRKNKIEIPFPQLDVNVKKK